LELLHGGFDGMKQFLVERKSPKKAFNKFHFTVHNHENELSFLQIDESFLYHHGWRTRGAIVSTEKGRDAMTQGLWTTILQNVKKHTVGKATNWAESLKRLG
jgi:hypothetical protein